MAAEGGNQKVIEEFQKSFVACLNSLRSGYSVRPVEGEEIKTDAEIAAQRFMESAQLAEMDFNRRYVLFASYRPEELLKQEIFEMKKEIERKDLLLKQYKEKLNHWQQILRPNMSTSSAAPSLPGFAPIQQKQQQSSSSNELS